ncbi:hypothetical protein ABT124_41320 [Streptomyces sp. NPDC001982]|uniref:3'-5' exonuclease n=1 Tax=Streptomyces sp. NPDC001982 TaxID=3154405 RepID=UPI00332F146F
MHGISDAMVADAPTFDKVLPELLRVTNGHTVLAYNEEHDRHIITTAADLGRSRTWDCLMEARSACEGCRQWLRLGGEHRALGDRFSTGSVCDLLAFLNAHGGTRFAACTPPGTGTGSVPRSSSYQGSCSSR